MGLDLVRMSPGQQDPQGHVRVGSYRGVHVFRAILLVMLVSKMWQEPDLDTAAGDALLGLLKPEAFQALGVDPDDMENTEFTEEDLQRLLSADTAMGLEIDYGAVFEDDPAMSLARQAEVSMIGSPVFLALVGAAKFIVHSDCDGVYTPGDAQDVLTFFEYIKDAPVQPDEMWRERIQQLHAFFTAASAARQCVVFA